MFALDSNGKRWEDQISKEDLSINGCIFLKSFQVCFMLAVHINSQKT